jgi:hypothetical protein
LIAWPKKKKTPWKFICPAVSRGKGAFPFYGRLCNVGAFPVSAPSDRSLPPRTLWNGLSLFFQPSARLHCNYFAAALSLGECVSVLMVLDIIPLQMDCNSLFRLSAGEKHQGLFVLQNDKGWGRRGKENLFLIYTKRCAGNDAI